MNDVRIIHQWTDQDITERAKDRGLILTKKELDWVYASLCDCDIDGFNYVTIDFDLDQVEKERREKNDTL